MVEHDARIGAYQHLTRLPRAADALHALRKISSLVKPIMRKRNWRVGTLKEFFPAEHNLQGLNVNRGESICLRLRHAGDERQFLPLEQVLDTMLHELSHIVHGPHDAKFQALWDELRDEYDDLKLKGYTGEGFLSEGRLLGGRNMPVTELRRKARVEAEERRRKAALAKGSGQKLGGAPVRRGVDMRNVIADAVARRNKAAQKPLSKTITEGCASGTSAADKVSRDADRNGFRTKAEEDDANDRAIAQALWEIFQEEEARNAGLEPPERTDQEPDLIELQAPPLPKRPRIEMQDQDRDTAPFDSSRDTPKISSSRTDKDDFKQAPIAAPPTAKSPAEPSSAKSDSSEMWACPVCTLVNNETYLCCEVCGSERPSTNQQLPTAMPPDPPPERTGYLGWNCRSCGTFMEHRWWTCSLCGVAKTSSSISR